MPLSAAYRHLPPTDKLVSCQHAVNAVVFSLSLVPQTALAIGAYFFAWTGSYIAGPELSTLVGVLISSEPFCTPLKQQCAVLSSGVGCWLYTTYCSLLQSPFWPGAGIRPLLAWVLCLICLHAMRHLCTLPCSHIACSGRCAPRAASCALHASDTCSRACSKPLCLHT